jgi:hypothetical protein
MPSAPAPVTVLSEIARVEETEYAPVVVRSMALAPVPPEREKPRTSAGIACVALTVSTLAAPLSCGLVPAATRFVGAPLAFSAG